MAPGSAHSLLTRRSLFAGVNILAVRPADAGAPVTVASKIDTEGGLIGEMILALLEAAGIPTRNRLQLGPTRILRAAILSGAIDLYPEYTGNAALFFAMDGDPVWKDARAGYERAKALDLQRNKLVWLQPAPADNSWVIAMQADFADAHRLATLDDFARWTREGGAVKLAASAEFVESRSGLPAFQDTYGFSLSARQLLVLSGGNTSATIKAAADHISGVNAAMAYGSDGALTALGLRALADTKHAQPVYALAPVVRSAVADAYPQIAGMLAPAFAALDLDTLRGLNEKIAIAGREARVVARTYLHERGLIK
ncbi:MAG: osmoprotectant transport system substrate-binding protein [Methylobacteriaceae bacterium]|nr:osmoprotectant transport system substrate-binding protein [Methylobacteriaceae bacterium]